MESKGKQGTCEDEGDGVHLMGLAAALADVKGRNEGKSRPVRKVEQGLRHMDVAMTHLLVLRLLRVAMHEKLASRQ